MFDLPGYIWLLVLTGVVGIPATTVAVLYSGARAAGVGRRRRGAAAVSLAVVWAGWLVASALLARAGVYQQASGEIPWFFVAVAGTFGALLLATRIPVVRRILAEPGMDARLVLPHALRVVGVVFLIVMALGHLPAGFALPAGLGDIAIGVTAPLVARRLAAGRGRSLAVRFHALGILDLLVAGAAGFLLLEFIDVTPTTVALTLLPLALVPTTAVPLAIALHVVALRRLLRPADAAAPVPASAAAGA
ncbi:MAG TPA: hypothetical protein VHF92_04860 [Geodermatophilus sp.]|nr:hypothetical protein [Geodermatophilus sp.]